MGKCKKMCLGCRNDFYNGKNPYDVKECLSYKNARLMNTIQVSTYDRPPWYANVEKRPDCYHSDGYVYLKNYDKITKGEHKGKFCYHGSKDIWTIDTKGEK